MIYGQYPSALNQRPPTTFHGDRNWIDFRGVLVVVIPQVSRVISDTTKPLKSRSFAFSNSEFGRIWARSSSFSRIAIFWGELAISSYHQRIRRRILRRYSWSVFFLGSNPSVNELKYSATPLSGWFLSNRLQMQKKHLFAVFRLFCLKHAAQTKNHKIDTV